MSRERVLEEFGIPVSEWGNCEDMADEIVRLRGYEQLVLKMMHERQEEALAALAKTEDA